MNIKRFLFVLASGFFFISLFSQDKKITWRDPAKNSFPVIEGQAWSKDVKDPYDRLPARAEDKVRKEVWNLSHHTAGFIIRFISNSTQIGVRYTTTDKNYSMPHMPSTGVSGVDMYAIGSKGELYWCRGNYSFGDTVSYWFNDLNPVDSNQASGREYRLYLPLYNGVKELEIGVPEGTTFKPLPVRAEKPIVVYGTSIAQGGCASRPGMAWTAIAGRKLDYPVINLAFSGNGRLETELVDLMAEIDAGLYVLDNMPNMNPFTPDEVRTRILNCTRLLRQKRPGVPILLVEHCGYPDGKTCSKREKAYSDLNIILREAFAQLKSEGMKNIFLLPIEDINLTMDGTVDGTHPNDLGMEHYAEAYEKHIRMILGLPKH